MPARALPAFVLASALLALPARALESVQWGGFALLRPQTRANVPLNDDALSAQVQVGVDWRPSPSLGAHIHLLARNEADGSRRGRAGVVQAFIEANRHIGRDRIRLLAGAFFLPTSRENIDSLWETPYTISSSALNSWFGEEFRPVGIDLSYRRPIAATGALTAGATVFRGNDTFGAFPIDRGWAIHDRWSLLGEHVPTNDRFFTSVSAETDGRLGWSARGKWNDNRGAVQYTHIDNRSDALLYGDLFNWATRFNVVGGDYSLGGWTVLGELGWGKTTIETRRGRFTSPIHASYLLVSRRLSDTVRASIRADAYKAGRRGSGDALTAALFWEPHPRLRAGIEGITAEGEDSLAIELRYRF